MADINYAEPKMPPYRHQEFTYRMYRCAGQLNAWDTLDVQNEPERQDALKAGWYLNPHEANLAFQASEDARLAKEAEAAEVQRKADEAEEAKKLADAAAQAAADLKKK